MAKFQGKLTYDEIETDVFSREKAKAELEKRIAEKLSRMSETDLEELFMLHEKQLKDNKAYEIGAAGRRGAFIYGQMSFGEVKNEEAAEGDEFDESGAPVNRNFQEYFDKFASGSALETLDRCLRRYFRKAASSSRVRKFKRFCKAVPKAIIALLSKLIPRRRLLGTKPISEGRRTRKARFVLLNYKRRFRRNEKKASTGLVNAINVIDRGSDKVAEVTRGIYDRCGYGVYSAREWADRNKRQLLAGLVVLITSAVVGVSVVNYFTAYVYAYNGRALGLVKHQEDVLRVLDVVSEQLTREYGAEVDIDKEQNITFERVFMPEQEIDDMQEVFNRLTYMQDMNVRAYALYIEDRRIAILETRDRAEEMLDDYTNIYMLQPHMGVIYEDISFAEHVEIRPIDTQLGRIQNPEDIIARMMTGAMAHKVHVVEKGETFSEIAKKYGLTMAQLEATNPDVTPAKLSIGQELIVDLAVPLLTVQTTEVATYPAVIPFETVYEDNPNIFKGEQSTKRAGVNGEREVTARITRNNGLEVAREELKEVIITEPVSAVILRGTKDPPPLQGTGKLIYPVSGARLTSRFGTRGGRMHYGIDLACKSGTRIGAADGGTVTFAGYNGSFGYLVIVNHGGNMETYYAHCSSMHVKKGDRVYQGQHIANVGSTGRSTGPHLHFEVHVNGVAKNPLSYL